MVKKMVAPVFFLDVKYTNLFRKNRRSERTLPRKSKKMRVFTVSDQEILVNENLLGFVGNLLDFFQFNLS